MCHEKDIIFPVSHFSFKQINNISNYSPTPKYTREQPIIDINKYVHKYTYINVPLHIYSWAQETYTVFQLFNCKVAKIRMSKKKKNIYIYIHIYILCIHNIYIYI